jgi:hypothetical protein
MPEHLHYDEDSMVNHETHHEESDVNVRALLIFFGVFVVFSVFTHFLIWFMYKGFVHLERRNAPPALTAVKLPADHGVPAQPRLQPFPSRTQGGDIVPPFRNTPVTDMQDMRRAEDQHLTTYGWVDQQKGTVRIPLDVAKQIALQRGFQVVAAPAPAATAAPGMTAPAVESGAAASQPATGTAPATTTAPANTTVPPSTVPPVAPAPARSGATP